jgi:Mg/Co/Ni transporter MgtE
VTSLGADVDRGFAPSTVIAVSIGGSEPPVLKCLGVGPAFASASILTTGTDICGFFCAL